MARARCLTLEARFRVQDAGCRVWGLGDDTGLGFRRSHELDTSRTLARGRTHARAHTHTHTWKDMVDAKY
jgi:hypothetical protein